MLLKALVFSLMFEGGWMPDNSAFIANDIYGKFDRYSGITQDNSWYVHLEPKLSIKINDNGVRLNISGYALTEMTKEPDREFFAPYQMTYGIEGSLQINWLELGYSHYCSHSMLLGKDIFNPVDTYDHAKTRLFVRATFSTEK